jgi:nicotinamidase-related amidase
MSSEDFASRTALLLMDFQPDILQALSEEKQKSLLKNAKMALKAARKKKVHVIFVRVAFRPGYPEVPVNSRIFSGIAKQGVLVEGTASSDIHPVLKPLDAECVVTKRRVGAFSTTDLESILRAKRISHLVLGGISTSGVVLSTLRWAADFDYDITVLRDCCIDRDEDVHDILMNKIFPRQATVMTVDQWISSLGFIKTEKIKESPQHKQKTEECQQKQTDTVSNSPSGTNPNGGVNPNNTDTK